MKKSIVLVLFAVFTIECIQAQVGINTATPDSSAALDIQSPSGGANLRGVLFPRMTTDQRNALGFTNPAQSLFVFDTDDMMFYYYDGGRWLGLVPTEPVGTSGTGTDPDVKGDITLTTGTISAPNLETNTLNVTGFSTNALVPTGAIIMWSGNPASLPAGWALCDGLMGRPDLSGRFIVGYGQNNNPAPGDINPNYLIGQTGGENSHLLTSAESGLPSHSHTSDPHNHNINNVPINTNDVDSGNDSSPIAAANETYTTLTTTSVSVTVNPNAAANASVAHENRPPYYVLAYIIKLP